MAGLVDIKWNPSRRELRQFGSLLLPAFLAIVGFLVYRRTHSLEGAVALWAGGAPSLLIGLVAPQILRPIFVGMMVVTYPIGFVVSHVVLAVFFYGVVTPIGLLLRLTGRDPMERTLDRQAKTYWVEHHTGRNPTRYFRQF